MKTDLSNSLASGHGVYEWGRQS